MARPWPLTEGVVAHNTIVVDGAFGIGVSLGDGTVAANLVTATGDDAMGIRSEDYGLGGPALLGNGFDVPDGCALRFGRDDLTCLSLEPCASCSSSSGNATAPDVPAPMNVIDLGAPTSLALDIAGECRDALPPAGAN